MLEIKCAAYSEVSGVGIKCLQAFYFQHQKPQNTWGSIPPTLTTWNNPGIPTPASWKGDPRIILGIIGSGKQWVWKCGYTFIQHLNAMMRLSACFSELMAVH